jgi:hypothetical protein
MASSFWSQQMDSNLVVARSIPGMGSRTFSDLASTSVLGGYIKAR